MTGGGGNGGVVAGDVMLVGMGHVGISGVRCGPRGSFARMLHISEDHKGGYSSSRKCFSHSFCRSLGKLSLGI